MSLNWIPISERLPETDDDVLITVDGDVSIGYYDESYGWFVYDEMYSKNVIAWIPLPEPYEGSDI